MPIVWLGLMSYAILRPPYNLFLAVSLWASVYVAIIRDAIRTARQYGDRYKLKSFNKWYVYLGIFLAVCAISPAYKVYMRNYVQVFKIPSGAFQIQSDASGAMAPTLIVGDRVLVDNSAYRAGKTPQRGDIIVFKYPEAKTKDFIRRIVGIPGDIVEVNDNRVSINGALLNDQKSKPNVDSGTVDRALNPRMNLGRGTVPEGSYFVIGDNRVHNLDPLRGGYNVELPRITGKVAYIYWSWDDKNSRVRWERLGKIVQ